MAEVLLLHHMQGLTDGLQAFVEELRAGGHTVHTPDLFDGERPATIDGGLALVNRVGQDVLQERADRALVGLPDALVYAGFSWGGATAQRYAQTRPGARGALLYDSCVSLTAPWAFGPWPAGVPVQIHGMDQDPFFALEGDLNAARELVGQVGPDLAELFLYPGNGHLFADSSLPSYDAEAAAQVVQRSLAFLDRVS